MALSSDSPSQRAKRLASISSQIVAELYEMHDEACEGKLHKPRRSWRQAKLRIDLD